MLTQDAALFASLRSVLAAPHQLIVVNRETELGEQLLAAHAAVALIDAATVTSPVERLTERLRAQFPDLVLVVAGDSQTQAALASQISSGVVYRFLRRPVSEQRVRLFVEAALRRHDEEQHAAVPSQATARQRPPRRAALVVTGGAVLALALAAGAWLVWHSGESSETPAPAASLETNVPGAGEAPVPSASPPEVQRSAPAIDPRLAELDRLLSAAEQAIVAGRLDEATRLVETARALQPGHVRVAFLAVQLEKERERQARGEARQEQELQRQLDARVTEVLELAEQRRAKGALMEPERDSASFYIESAAALDPDSPAVAAARAAFQEQILGLAATAIEEGHFDTAESWLAAAGAAGAPSELLAARKRALQDARVAAEADRITRLSREFALRLQREQLFEPADDSAEFHYQRLLGAAPEHPATLQARQSLVEGALQAARRALARSDAERADELRAGALRIDPAATAAAAALQRDIEAARAAAGIVPADSLDRIRYVAPRYPRDAERAGAEGWVDLEFTVAADGSVRAPRVLRSEPGGLFDAAALEAVRRWRYRPVERAGEKVEQRTQLRIRFRVDR